MRKENGNRISSKRGEYKAGQYFFLYTTKTNDESKIGFKSLWK